MKPKAKLLPQIKLTSSLAICGDLVIIEKIINNVLDVTHALNNLKFVFK